MITLKEKKFYGEQNRLTALLEIPIKYKNFGIISSKMLKRLPEKLYCRLENGMTRGSQASSLR